MASVDATSEAGNDCPPVRIVTGGLPGGEVAMPGNLSSQYFTGLMMAAPAARGTVTIRVDGELISRPYIDITAEVMRAFTVKYPKTIPTGALIENGNYVVLFPAGAPHARAVFRPDGSFVSVE